MTTASFAANYSDWKLIRTRKTVQIVLEIPVEKSNEAYQALGGMPNAGEEIWVAVARLDPTKLQSGDTAPDREAAGQLGRSLASRSHKPVASDRRLAQRAGILCADPVFRTWIGELCHKQDVTEQEAADFVRTECDVSSRKDIAPGSEAGHSFEKMEGAFLGWRDHDMPAEIPA